MRYKKPIVRELNLETIQSELWETQYTIKSRHPDLQNWEDRVIVIGYENAREMRENSERILKEHINGIVGEPKYPVSDYYVVSLRRCRIKEDK